MLNQYKIITATHKKIHLKKMGDFAIQAGENTSNQTRLEELKARFGIEELMYTATCNRVMYFFWADFDITEDFVQDFFEFINPELSPEIFAKINDLLFVYEGLSAIEHLLDVAASIDSLVIGERQILGQLRNAYDQCKEWGFVEDNLRLAMNYAVVTAKEIYSKTRIGDKPVSVVSLAIQKLLRTNLPKDSRILMVGAGDTNQLVAKFLDKHDYTNLSVFNRTLAKAEAVAEIVGGKAFSLAELDNYQEGFDCLIVCTGASSPILSPWLYKRLLNGEDNKKIIIDLAIPHNTAPEVLEQFPVEYIEIEGLRNLAQENLGFREKEVQKAKLFLEDKLTAFSSHYKQRQLEKAMSEVPKAIKAVKVKALNEVFHKEMAELDDPTKALVEKMMAYMEKKCIGIPMKVARETIF